MRGLSVFRRPVRPGSPLPSISGRAALRAASFIALALIAPVATAAPGDAALPAAAHAEAGKRHYKERRYDEAIMAFEQAYELDPHPALLFNIAQAHRHRGDPERAIAAFERYLMRSPRSKQRAFVETRLQELRADLARAASEQTATPAAPPATPALSGPPPAAPDPAPAVATARPEAPAPPAEETPPDSDELEPLESEAIIAEIEDSRRPGPRGDWRVLLQSGLALPQFSGVPSTDARPFFAGFASVTYAVPFGAASLDFGLAANWSPLAYRTRPADNQQPRRARQSQLVGGFVTGGARLALGRSFSMGPALALGMMWWGGLVTDNPYTSRSQGNLPLPAARVGVPATWRLGSVVFVGLEPAVTYGKITSREARSILSSISWFTFSAIVGLQL